MHCRKDKSGKGQGPKDEGKEENCGEPDDAGTGDNHHPIQVFPFVPDLTYPMVRSPLNENPINQGKLTYLYRIIQAEKGFVRTGVPEVFTKASIPMLSDTACLVNPVFGRSFRLTVF